MDKLPLIGTPCCSCQRQIIDLERRSCPSVLSVLRVSVFLKTPSFHIPIDSVLRHTQLHLNLQTFEPQPPRWDLCSFSNWVVCIVKSGNFTYTPKAMANPWRTGPRLCYIKLFLHSIMVRSAGPEVRQTDLVPNPTLSLYQLKVGQGMNLSRLSFLV